MAAEIVVIVEHQDAGVRPVLAEEISGRKAAYPAPYDHKIIMLFGILRLSILMPAFFVADLVGRFKGSRVATPHSMERRRIVTLVILRKPAFKEWVDRRRIRSGALRKRIVHRAQGCPDSDRNPVHKVPAIYQPRILLWRRRIVVDHGG